jgi:hypothetical protein
MNRRREQDEIIIVLGRQPQAKAVKAKKSGRKDAQEAQKNSG